MPTFELLANLSEQRGWGPGYLKQIVQVTETIPGHDDNDLFLERLNLVPRNQLLRDNRLKNIVKRLPTGWDSDEPSSYAVTDVERFFSKAPNVNVEVSTKQIPFTQALTRPKMYFPE